MSTDRITFTKQKLEKLPLPAKGERSTYLDIKMAGLQLRVTASGVKTFSLYRRTKRGEPERVTLGRFPDLSVEQARAKAQELNAAIAFGSNPNEEIRAAKAELTLAEMFDAYLKRHAIPQGRKTVPQMRENFERYLGYLGTPQRKPHGRQRVKPKGSVDWSKRKLSAISRNDVQKLHTALGAHSGNYIANRAIELLSAMYNKATAWGLFKGENPISGVEVFKETSRDRFIQKDEMRPVFDALAAEENELIRDFFLMSLLTGVRRGNVLAMQWDAVSIERAEWHIPDSKNDTPQTVTLVPEAIEILTRRLPERINEWVFPGSGVTGHLLSPKKAWRRVLDRAGISNLRIHDLRRTLGSYQARTGASLVIIGKSLNHKSQQSTAIYARLDLDPVRQSVERATSEMLVAAGRKSPAVVSTFDTSLLKRTHNE